ncbi:uncharacterized protein LY89DRAFT_669630 [Mollisia scopiformis]|uniref:Uncharacterized protein n=1 Tax=Mollisia scopiformis TaxID=149040 RepID=A0A194XAQ7_MOLSC|nr:uncharacterized protein LY89DRAFT_669630 [Mollisia scopiformis]KUJ17224.1 hypothetical protein LY89DRAFT_669630 [Mollisia scopiformis]
MDAAEDDQDVKLQRASADLLADFQSSITPFLWKTRKSGKTQIRDQVRSRDTERLVNLLEPFQELPQLLDPHLDKFVPLLADAFLASLQAPSSKTPPINAHLLMPISKAICKLLYTFCKIRGDKVIVRFWSTEIKYLELLLTALESNKPAEPLEDKDTAAWDWEERYITLLWLSQLLLAPFDLASISSGDLDEIAKPTILGLLWPPDVPTITVRAISLGIQYISSSGKERDAAKVLLVRIAMRRDMQSIGIQEALMQWAIRALQFTTDLDHSTYYYIGVLSFLAAILISSVGTTNMDSFTKRIFRVIQNITTEDSAMSKMIRGSAVARKAIVKILRTIVVLLLQHPDPSEDPIEFTIGHMLDSLGDSATPVRLAASKALSIITLKLPADMAHQVVEEVLDSLKKNVLWKTKGGHDTRNLSRVNPLEWHGLTLTLSHLLYRQSIPAGDLAPVLDALRLALSFEQRSTSGSSIGTNVRDAACFGIWAVARRYKTVDLQELHLSPDITTIYHVEATVSALQTLANDLVVSACVDPAGNIRRGSSAALQELIGRHPNIISEGIQVVQVVDYHAVALRTRAISDVALKAAQLSEDYREAILRALLGWRGVKDANPAIRRVAANTVGELVWLRHLATSPSWRAVQSAIDEIARQVTRLEAREFSERHGLILAFSAVVVLVNSQLSAEKLHDEFHRILHEAPAATDESGLYTTIVNINGYQVEFFKELRERVQSSRHQEILSEAFAELMIATSQIPQRLTLFGKFEASRTTKTLNLSQCGSECWIRQLIMTPLDLKSNPHEFTVVTECTLLSMFVSSATSAANFGILAAAAESFVLLESGLVEKTPDSSGMIGQWIVRAVRGRGSKDLVYIHVLIPLFPLMKSMVRDSVTLEKFRTIVLGKMDDPTIDRMTKDWQFLCLHAIMNRWEQDSAVETRAAILECLARNGIREDLPTMLQIHTGAFIRLIEAGLQDFTTTARGDVGSQVRIAAARAATAILSSPMTDYIRELLEQMVVGGLLRIAAEKLDKVRVEGQKVLAHLNDHTSNLTSLAPSSQEYFSTLLNLQIQEWWTACPRNTGWAISLLEGYITSADTGSEDLVRASRAALVDFCNSGHDTIICDQLFQLAKKSKVDRVLIPTLETIGFLFDMGIMQRNPPRYVTPSYLPESRRPENTWEEFCDVIKATHLKSSNVRKLQAVVKIYGGLIEVYPEATTKLSSMLLHSFPQIRNAVADELWVAKEVGKGVDWAKAGRNDLIKLRKEIKQRREEDASP